MASFPFNFNFQEVYWYRPEWVPKRQQWPPDIETKTTPESQEEAKVKVGVAQGQTDMLDTLPAKSTLWRTLRVCAWMGRFIHNARSAKSDRNKGPLTTEEINRQRLLWLKKVQENFKLNLQENESGLECTGRIQGVYPIYVPDSHQFALKLVGEEHKTTLHGGVGLTMAKIREQYWITRLRRLAKKVIKSCNGRKRFHFTAFTSPAPGQLPRDRTEGQNAFRVIGVDQSRNN